MRRALLLALTVLCSVGCARSNAYELGDADASLDGGADSGRIGMLPDAGDVGPRYDVFIDPGCDAGPRDGGDGRMYECDPLDFDSCDFGLACYAGAIPPSGPCGEEIFISYCAVPGPGEQGDDCLGHNECAAGHLCVVTGAGTQCVNACDVGGGEPSCPRGYLCRSTDVPGYGACF